MIPHPLLSEDDDSTSITSLDCYPSIRFLNYPALGSGILKPVTEFSETNATALFMNKLQSTIKVVLSIAIMYINSINVHVKI